eukprot:11166066-Lingulodinium_polyedra.AAC.1
MRPSILSGSAPKPTALSASQTWDVGGIAEATRQGLSKSAGRLRICGAACVIPPRRAHGLPLCARQRMVLRS